MHKFFDKQTLFIGWSIFWHVWLVALAVEVAVFLVFLLPPLSPRAVDVGQILSFVLVTATWIWTCDWAGKGALSKRNLPIPTRFIGWSIFWRAFLLTLLFALVPIFLILTPGELWLPQEGLKLITRLLALAALVVLTSYAYGWAVLQVSQKFTKIN